MEESAKKGLLIVLIGMLLLPIVQKNFPFIDSGPLYGYFDVAPDIDFSWSDWWVGNYRERKGKYLNDNVALRPDMIRLNNQVDYSLFTKLHFYDDMLGSDHCLWDCSYAEAYLGIDYIGYDAIEKTLLRLKRIQDTLASMGKPIILVNAACKGYFYPDNLPPHLTKVKRGATNLETCVRICDSLGINQVNFNAWLLSIKNKTPQLLYPKKGTHWSVYAAALAADSMVRYIEGLMHIEMPHMYWNKIINQEDALFTDDDLCKPLNLIFPFTRETYSYPQIEYTGDTAKKKPNVIYIGDSFFCQWMYLGIPDHVNNDWQYWAYFNGITSRKYQYGDPRNPHVKDIDWIGEIEKCDCVVLIWTARNLPLLNTWFIDQAYDHYFPEK